MNRDQARRLGKYIRQLRRANKLPARGLAPHVGVDASQILRLERGEVAAPQAALLIRIADYFRIPAADFFALAGYPAANNLPSIEAYLQAKYPGLSHEALRHILSLVESAAPESALATTTSRRTDDQAHRE